MCSSSDFYKSMTFKKGVVTYCRVIWLRHSYHVVPEGQIIQEQSRYSLLSKVHTKLCQVLY